MYKLARTAMAMAAFGSILVQAPVWAAEANPVPAQPAQEMAKDAPAEAEVTISEDVATAKVGEAVKDFTLKDIEGKEHSLSDYKGKIVVLSWTNPECPFIVEHNKAKTIDMLADKYADEDVVILQIDSTKTGTTDRLKAMREQYGIKTTILEDYSGDTARYFQAQTSPHVFVIDREGKLVYSGALDNAPLGKVAEGEERVNYPDAVVEDLLAGREVSYSTTKPYGCSVKY